MTETLAEEAERPDTDDVPEEVDAGDRPVRRRDVVLLLGATVVLVAGLFVWWQGAHHDSAAVAKAETRDAVLIAATRHIETMNTLDYRHVDAGLKRWQRVTTGTLHDQLANVSEQDRQLLADQRKISTGKVVDAAVVDVDDDNATVLAAVEVTVRSDDGKKSEPAVKRNRYSADLVKVDGKWLLESLEQVAVSVS